MMPRVSAVSLIVAAGLSLTACGSGYFGDIEDDLILPGERIPIVLADDDPKADDSLAEKPVALPPPRLNADWPQVGGDAGHAVGHLALDDAPQQVWRRRVGRGSDDRRRLGAPPVVAEGRVFTVDTDGQVAALNMADGRVLWRTATVIGDDDERTLFAGGLARVGEMVLLARGDGRLIALAAADGSRRWSVATGMPLRGAPVVDGDQVVVVGLNNTAQAHAIEDGRLLWQHRGFDESATVFGGASVAMSGPWTVVPYSSGEVFALRRTNGRVVWADNFSAYRGGKGLTSMATIGGYPVIDRDMVLVSSHSGRLTALDLTTGTRLWERRLGGFNPPWPAGDYVFVIDRKNRVLCLRREDGRVRWVTALPLFSDPEERADPITVHGPVLAGDRLLVADSTGRVSALSPYDGAILGSIKVGAPVFLPPVVVDQTVLVLDDDGTLTAYR